MTHIKVTADNIDLIRERIPADQADEVQPGCYTYTWSQSTGDTINATVWPDVNVAAICYGGDSAWGRYTGSTDWFDVDAWEHNAH